MTDSARRFAIVNRSVLRTPFRALVGCLGMALMLQNSFGQSLQVRTQLSKQKVQIAEPFVVTIDVEIDATWSVVWPDWVDDSDPPPWGGCDVVQVRHQPSIPLADARRRRWRLSVQLECLDTGIITLPPLEFAIRDQQSQPVPCASQTQTIDVQSVLDPEQSDPKLRDIQAVLDPPPEHRSRFRWFAWTSIAVAGASLSLLTAGLWWRRRQGNGGVADGRWIRDQLKQLRAAGEAGQLNWNQGVSRLSDLLREFLAWDAGLPESCPTGTELIEQIAHDQQWSQRMEPDALSQLKRLFDLADQSRYAGVTLDRQSFFEVLDSSERIVEQTIRYSGTRPKEGRDV